MLAVLIALLLIPEAGECDSALDALTKHAAAVVAATATSSPRTP